MAGRKRVSSGNATLLLLRPPLLFPSPLVGERGIGDLQPPSLKERRRFASAMAPDEGFSRLAIPIVRKDPPHPPRFARHPPPQGGEGKSTLIRRQRDLVIDQSIERRLH